jgi:phospholipid/cholesterol/gamma-HCH transport system substrate-binding protein
MAGDLRQSFKTLNSVMNNLLVLSQSLEQTAVEIKKGKGLAGKIIGDTVLGGNLSDIINQLRETSVKLNTVSEQLNTTIKQANTGKGTVNMLLSDTVVAANVQQSILNIKNASIKLDENMEAMKHNFLTRGYFRKQAKKGRKK